MVSTIDNIATESVVDRKLERLSRGERPRTLDLFSGCGGISLGFELAGCEMIGGVELDPHAARSHAINFHKDNPSFDL